jgi:serine/threonine protein kinase
MQLAAGTRLGPYEIVGLIGAGGMGEVYRARDTTLGRDVALKLLPAALSDDPERVARFQREAHLLASLNHPHIGAIYGLEQLPSARFLVLELLEGGTLADRVARGSMPPEEATAIARQIALALQAAHDKGVVHRDLKPSNVAFTTAGDVKVLDFGLAKLGERDEISSTNVSLSPTITSPALMTSVGTLLGTAAYMAPEQAKGRAADKRSDVWAFGCVLYEMLSGRRAFEGDDVADTLANVLKVEPDWSRLPPSLPSAITVLLRRCLAKDARQRCGDMAAALILLEESAHLSSVLPSSPSERQKPALWRRGALPAVAVAAAALAGGGVWWALRPEPPRIVRTILVADKAGSANEIAITPDGTHVVYVGNNNTRLLVRALTDLEPRPLVNGNNLRGVFTSPDGQSVGYSEGGNALMRAALPGGPAILVARLDAPLRGATWMIDDTIVFGTGHGTTGLQRVAASGGEVTVLTTPDPKQGEGDHILPTRLPDGRGVLFTLTSNVGGAAQIALLDVVSGDRKILVRGTHARYVESGHLVFAADGILQAVPFDLDARTISGRPVPVLQHFAMLGGMNMVLDAATNGTLVYVPGSATSRLPVWVNREGREETIKGPNDPHLYLTPRLSPDGRRLAFFEPGGDESDVWIQDLDRGTVERLTSDQGRDSEPIWSSDSTRIAYLSTGQPGGPGIFVRRADGTGGVTRLTQGTHLPQYWSADGKWLGYADFGERGISVATVSALMAVDVEGDHTPRTLIKGSGGRIAPTERWVAVPSTATGTTEIYVLPFPDVSRTRWRISTDGGQNPTWAPDGKTLFYRRGQAIMAVTIDGDDPRKWSKPKMLFGGPYLFDAGPTQFDAAPDGRLLMVRVGPSDDADGAAIIAVQNWFEDLRRLAPRK